MKHTRIIPMIVLLLSTALLSAQPRGTVVTGKIVSADERLPLEGAMIQVKGTRNISGTLYDGVYAIEIRAVDSVLVFSYEGYETKEVKIVADRREYNVVLKTELHQHAGKTKSAFNNPVHK